MNTFVYVCKLIVYCGTVGILAVVACAVVRYYTEMAWLGLFASLLVGAISGLIPWPQRANAGQSQPTSEPGEEPQRKEEN